MFERQLERAACALRTTVTVGSIRALVEST
jgi:hypothetical protein